jgi:GNAT superfamily N-acetyltransferase
MTTHAHRAGNVSIEELDLTTSSDELIGELTAFRQVLYAESHPEDAPPTFEYVSNEVRLNPSFVRVRSFLGRDGSGAIVASAYGSWTILEENTHLLDVGIHVHPGHRTSGVGTTLLERLVRVADDAGRTTLMGRSNDRVPAGERFARRIGATLGLVQGMNRLVLADLDTGLVQRWVDEGPSRAPGYSLVAVDGRYPDELVEQIVDLHAVMNTAPRDDLETDDERPTVATARSMEEMFFATGLERWYLAARHDATGQLVGWTEVGWAPDTPDTVWQWGTGVRPEHRGHALGKWLKAVMLQRILEARPGAVDIRTTNADSNDAMLGINRALGFARFHTNFWWQVKIDRVKGYLVERRR